MNARSASRLFGIGWSYGRQATKLPSCQAGPGTDIEVDFEDNAYGYRPKRSGTDEGADLEQFVADGAATGARELGEAQPDVAQCA